MSEIAAKIKENYNSKWQVFTVSEASSFLYTGRVERHTLNENQIYQWQKDVLKTIQQLESVYDNIADHETARHTLIICDRGGMDPKAYTPGEDTWNKILEELQTDEKQLLERYHIVIQMHTAPKEFYSTVNNPYRRENYDEAAEINQKYEKLWRNHHNFHSVDNFDARDQQDGWAKKSKQVYQHIKNIIDEN
ncbi:unnamed protein product [Bursaphelenchus okinawaensis]|uniref:NadR/Ttd14 AAA domain-containing protein n=1 Tax=Bursaphelenchus okinawaensis TaxID=465554 RepID=A0A811K8K7_9BILA|nr:unnamed protein product [Bursaphelenchus okinawaensis]CAG9095043.1 unnamed protein product [Bursaphelenchus okinawaensis]